MNVIRLATIMLIGCVLLHAQTPNTETAQMVAPPLKVTILGSGGGPSVDLQRFGPSILVETSVGDKLLFDCGRGFAQRLTEYGVSLGAVDKLFLTHLHSDHILSIPDLLLVGWMEGRMVPLQVWGPAGTKSMMDYMGKTFEFDTRARADFDDRLTEDGIRSSSSDIREGTIYEKNGVKVTAFLVDHGPVKPAFGYRVDYAGHSVAMSGDTRFSENLIKHSQGVDLLIHEAAQNRPPNPK
jgi:ribonuclease Z